MYDVTQHSLWHLIISEEKKNRVRIDDAVGIKEVKVHLGGDYVLSFYNGEEEHPKKVIKCPMDNEVDTRPESFPEGLAYTLIFNSEEYPQKCNIDVTYYERLPQANSPLTIND